MMPACPPSPSRRPLPARRCRPVALRPVAALFGLTALIGLGGCTSFPAVPITTPEPIEVNIKMRVDVHQIGAEERSQIEEIQQREREDVIERLRDRSGEIQELKNNRLIGENHRGLLTILNKPAGTWGEYTVETVDAENADRMSLMRWEADEGGRRLEQVQREQAAQNIAQSFPGEWVEIRDEETNRYEWRQLRERPEAIRRPGQRDDPQPVQDEDGDEDVDAVIDANVESDDEP